MSERIEIGEILPFRVGDRMVSLEVVKIGLHVTARTLDLKIIYTIPEWKWIKQRRILTEINTED